MEDVADVVGETRWRKLIPINAGSARSAEPRRSRGVGGPPGKRIPSELRDVVVGSDEQRVCWRAVMIWS